MLFFLAYASMIAIVISFLSSLLLAKFVFCLDVCNLDQGQVAQQAFVP